MSCPFIKPSPLVPSGWVLIRMTKVKANGSTVCSQIVEPLAINLLELYYPARWAGLGKWLGFGPKSLSTGHLGTCGKIHQYLGHETVEAHGPRNTTIPKDISPFACTCLVVAYVCLSMPRVRLFGLPLSLKKSIRQISNTYLFAQLIKSGAYSVG